MRTTAAHVALTACAALLLTGCIEFADSATTAQPTTNAQVIEASIEWALEEGKASDRQVEALRNALARGEITRADIDAAFGEHLDCLETANVEYIVVEEPAMPGSGVSLPGAMIYAPDQNSTREVDIDDACAMAHDAYIKGAYIQQPWAVEAVDTAWTSDAVRDCLASHGYPSDDDATAAEIRALDVQDWTDNADDPAWDPCVSTATNPFDTP